MLSPPSISLAQGSSNLKRSIMRELLAYAVDPSIISLAGGLPPSDAMAVDAFADCLQHVIHKDGSAALQYSPQLPELRDWIAQWMSARGAPCQPDQVFITNGNQQGLAILSRLLLDPGEPAIVEKLTFTGIQQVTDGRGAQLRPVDIDPHTGVEVEAFAAALRQTPKPKLAIVIPAYHNPLSATLPADKRTRLAALAAEYGVPLIEDDPYSALQFEGDPIPPIKAHDEAGFVFYLGSFSKILAPAVRLGWIVAPAELIPKITVLRESFDLESSTLIQRAVLEFVQRGLLDRQLDQMRQRLRPRHAAMQAALSQHLTGYAEWTRPDGGLFVWVTLPDGLDTMALFERAVAERVAYIPGAAFAVQGGHANCLRLSFGNVSEENIRVGVERLAQVLIAAQAVPAAAGG